MRSTFGLPAILALAALGACSSSAPEQPPEVVESRAVSLVQAGIPGATAEQARSLMDSACKVIAVRPTVATINLLRVEMSKALGGGVRGAVGATAVIGSAVAARCPEYRDLARQADE